MTVYIIWFDDIEAPVLISIHMTREGAEQAIQKKLDFYSPRYKFNIEEYEVQP